MFHINMMTRILEEADLVLAPQLDATINRFKVDMLRGKLQFDQVLQSSRVQPTSPTLIEREWQV
ncbi:hypothetical protein Fmac_031816 [Flemingia macrophylla]|uniref:Uncharacterized protein n=1 Tax=Flemingia macrophylla TaxID=520843 RepID=A0ABD1L352_9FABA